MGKDLEDFGIVGFTPDEGAVRNEAGKEKLLDFFKVFAIGIERNDEGGRTGIVVPVEVEKVVGVGKRIVMQEWGDSFEDVLRLGKVARITGKLSEAQKIFTVDCIARGLCTIGELTLSQDEVRITAIALVKGSRLFFEAVFEGIGQFNSKLKIMEVTIKLKAGNKGADKVDIFIEPC